MRIKVFLGFFLAILLVSSTLFGTTRYLASGTSDQTSTFQNLVNLSVTGDVIVVQTGNHYLSGTVNINKNGITVRGDNGNKILKSGSVSCIDIRCNNSTIDNLYIDGANMPEPCMRVYGSYNTIKNSTFRNSGNSGLLIDNCNHNTINACFAYYNYMVGISQWAHSDATVSNCQMYENGAEGLTIDGGTHNNKVFGNWIHKNNLQHRGVGGIGIDASNGSQIYNNTIDYNGYDGVKLQNNLCCGIDGANIYNNANISYNEQCAVKFRLTQPVTNFGWSGNTCIGNPGGERCSTYTKSAQIAPESSIVEKESPFEVYPNPANKSISLKNVSGIVDLCIVNIYGQEVLYFNQMEPSHVFSVATLSKGIYIVKVTTNSGITRLTQFIKE